MDNIDKQKLVKYFQTIPALKLVYFVGSRARNQAGVMSDYDFALYFDSASKSEMVDIEFQVIEQISKILVSDNIDIVILNKTNNPVLFYQIIKDGIMLLEKEPYKILFESQVLAHYFDYNQIMHNNHLTKAKV